MTQPPNEISMDGFGLWTMKPLDHYRRAVKEFFGIRERYQLSPEGDFTMGVLNIYGQIIGAPSMNSDRFEHWLNEGV